MPWFTIFKNLYWRQSALIVAKKGFNKILWPNTHVQLKLQNELIQFLSFVIFR